MFSRLCDIMQLKTWPEAEQHTQDFMHRYAHLQPAAVHYLVKNWFRPEWLFQWVAAARRFEHSDHDTNLAIEKFHDVLKH